MKQILEYWDTRWIFQRFSTKKPERRSGLTSLRKMITSGKRVPSKPNIIPNVHLDEEEDENDNEADEQNSSAILFSSNLKHRYASKGSSESN